MVPWYLVHTLVKPVPKAVEPISNFLRSEALLSVRDWKFPYKKTKSINKLP